MPTADRKPEHVEPEFRARVLQAIDMLADWCDVHAPGVVPEFGEGFRSVARQKELYAQGRSKPGAIVTYRDGVNHRSEHQSGLACDLWLKVKGKNAYDWDGTPALWRYWGHCVRAVGLKWGGDWGKFKDQPHCEWDPADTAKYRQAREWLAANGLK